MRNSTWIVSMLATVISVGYAPMSRADTPTTPMPAATVSSPTLGQDQTVSYNNKFAGIGFGKTISKNVTVEPGNHQVSLDGIKLRDKVNLTLVNPSATPLQFETNQRWGKQVVAVIPPHSQEVVSLSKGRPFTHEIKYSVMQQPSNAISTNEDYVTQQAAAVSADEQTAMNNALQKSQDQQTTSMRGALDQQTADLQTSQKSAMQEAVRQQYRHEGRSAVRGYW